MLPIPDLDFWDAPGDQQVIERRHDTATITI